MKIEIKQDHHTYAVEFKTGFPLKWTSGGKTWNRTTQCLVWADGLLLGYGEVRRHESDKDDLNFAKKLAAKKAFEKTYLWKELRSKFWTEINKSFQPQPQS